MKKKEKIVSIKDIKLVDDLIDDKVKLKEWITVQATDEDEDWNILSQFNDRYILMKAARSDAEIEWDLCDKQTEARVYEDNNWKMKVNSPLEKNLIEFYAWRNAWKIIFDIEPVGQADVEELQSSKFILNHFIDDSENIFNFYSERRRWLYNKAKYWTAVFYLWITYNREVMYEPDESNESFYETKYVQYYKENWCFTPREVPVRDFFIDQAATFQSDFSKVRDVIYKETLSLKSIKEKWQDVPWFRNLDQITQMVDIDPSYWKQPIRNETAVVYYYFNRETKDYWIITNRNNVIYTWKMLYDRLPFELTQHYPNPVSIWGEWICRRIRSVKWYKNITLQTMLDKMQIGAWINIWIWSNWMPAGELYTWSGEVNMWNFTNNIDQVKQFKLDDNVNTAAAIMNLIDDLTTQDIGENIKSPYQIQADTLWQTQIIEENKAIRQKNVDELLDISMDSILTFVLKNIRKFAPVLLKKKIKNKDWKVEKVIYPVIKIKDVRIEKKKWKNEFIEDMGEYGFFEFKPETIKHDMTVRVITASTKTSLKALEVDKFDKFINWLAIVWKVNPAIFQKVNVDMIYNWMNLTFWLEEKLTATTKKDEIKKANLKLVKETMDMMWKWSDWLPWSEEQPWTGDITWMPWIQAEWTDLGWMWLSKNQMSNEATNALYWKVNI